MTIVMIRSNQKETNFIDSPEGMCNRTGGWGFSCMILAGKYTINNSTLLFTLPYSETLHNISIKKESK